MRKCVRALGKQMVVRFRDLDESDPAYYTDEDFLHLDTCEMSRQLVQMMHPFRNETSRAAFRAYSKLLCLEVKLAEGICVPDWQSRVTEVASEAKSNWNTFIANNYWRLSSDQLDSIYTLHRDIVSSHARSIAQRALFIQCVPETSVMPVDIYIVEEERRRKSRRS